MSAVPELRTVTVVAALEVLSVELSVAEVGETASTGTSTVPLSVTVCDVAGAATVTAIDPVFAPVVVGVNVTDTVQLAPAATLVPHPLVIAN